MFLDLAPIDHERARDVLAVRQQALTNVPLSYTGTLSTDSQLYYLDFFKIPNSRVKNISVSDLICSIHHSTDGLKSTRTETIWCAEQLLRCETKRAKLKDVTTSQKKKSSCTDFSKQTQCKNRPCFIRNHNALVMSVRILKMTFRECHV